MIETRGNLWTHPNAEVVVITTNGTVKRDGTCVMGRGCAKEARDKFPGLDFKIGTLLTQHGNRPFVLRVPNNGDSLTLATFPVKHNWWEDADLKLIARSADLLVAMADKFGWSRVLMPRPGCGNGNLEWEGAVKPILDPILDDRFCVTTY